MKLSRFDSIDYAVVLGNELNEADRLVVYDKYPELVLIEECVKDFRDIFSKKAKIS